MPKYKERTLWRKRLNSDFAKKILRFNKYNSYTLKTDIF